MKTISKTYKIAFFCLLGILGLGSCKKWLDVQPEDKFTKTQMYQSPEGVKELVNGFYLNLGDNQLYGRNLTLTTLEVMAQKFRITSEFNPYYNFSTLKQGESNVMNLFSGVWIKMYATIANINDFVSTLPTVENGMSPEDKNLLIGEAIGLRAFIHFDLLRLFGPSYGEDTKSIPALPYVKRLSIDIMPYSTSEEYTAQLLDDIETAKDLLKNDIIRTRNNPSDFRTNKFNYYAVLALEARVHQWSGNRPAAKAAADLVIQAKDTFPWVTHQAITANGSNPDRGFSSEVIFNVFNRDLYENQKILFDSNIEESSILATGPNNYINDVYENMESDYRYSYSWPLASTGVGFRTFVKFQDVTDTKLNRRHLIPLIRISEMYYIAAESTDEPAEALNYLNTVRQHRNLLVDVIDYSKLDQEITKEYLKEFYGEGQVWYYYKRKRKTDIFSVNVTSLTKTMTLADYTIPLPLVETDSR